MSEPQNGIWNQWQADQYHQSSPKLAAWLASYLPKGTTVLDLGCGNAFYCAELSKNGFKCLGVEGYELNNFLHDNIQIRDLTKPLVFYGGYENVLSLEVGEHLPKEAEQTFLDNVCFACNNNLIISWALPGQPGVGHVNTQPASYIISEVQRRGFEHDEYVTHEARQNIDKNCDWFERTLLIFKRTK
jgi:hypothetical protein